MERVDEEVVLLLLNSLHISNEPLTSIKQLKDGVILTQFLNKT